MEKNLVIIVLFLSFIMYICYQHENSRYEKEQFVVKQTHTYINN